MELDVYKEWLGIPDGPRPPDHYTLLRLVQFEDNAEKVRNNYKKLNGHVRKYASGQYSVKSQALLNEIAKAMLCLTDPERKREYDETMGREFPEDAGATVPMERILAKQGHITRDQIKEAEEFADRRGLSMRDAVVQMKMVTQEIATQALAEELKLPYVDLGDMTPDEEVLDQTPKVLCSRNSLLPLFIDDNRLMVACADEPTHQCEDELRLRFGVPMRRVMATPTAVNAAIAKFYAPGLRDDAGSKPAAAKATKPPKAESKKGTTEKEAPAEAAKPAPAAAKSLRFKDLPPDQQAQRKQVGMILMMWAFIGGVVIDSFWLSPLLIKLKWGLLVPIAFLPSLPTIAVISLVVMFVLLVYWK